MKVALLLLLLGGIAAADSDIVVVTRLTVALGKHDGPAACTALAEKVELGYLWFADAKCAKQFAKPRTIGTTERDALVACLIGLDAKGVAAAHGTRHAGAIRFASGLQLGVDVADGLVARLGFVDTDVSDLDIPTVDGNFGRKLAEVSFEPTQATRDAIGKARVTTSHKICLDAKGNVTRSRVVAPSGVAGYDRETAAKLATWKHAPVKLGGKTIAACEVITFTYPLGAKP